MFNTEISNSIVKGLLFFIIIVMVHLEMLGRKNQLPHLHDLAGSDHGFCGEMTTNPSSFLLCIVRLVSQLTKVGLYYNELKKH